MRCWCGSSARRITAPASPSATSTPVSRAHPGIAAVFTAADVPGRNCFGVIPAFADQPVLAEGEARFRGEAVAPSPASAAAIEPSISTDFPVRWTRAAAALDSLDAALRQRRR